MKIPKISEFKILLAIVLAISLIVFLISPIKIMTLLENRVVDYFFIFRNNILKTFANSADDRIVLITIDEESLSRIKKASILWIPEIAEVTEGVLNAGSSVVGIDMLFSISLEEALNIQDKNIGDDLKDKILIFSRLCDKALIKAISSDRVIIPFDIKSNLEPKFPSMVFWRYSIGRLAASNLSISEDGIVRYAYPFYTYLSGNGKKAYMPSFAFLIFSKYMHIDIPLNLDDWSKNFPLCNKNNLMINYVGSADSFKSYPFYLILEKIRKNDGKFLIDFKDKIVLIGDKTSTDLANTPFLRQSPFLRTPGVEVNANIINTLLLNNPIKRVGQLFNYLIILLIIFVGLMIAYVFRPVYGAILNFLLLIVYFIISFYFFVYRQTLLPNVSIFVSLVFVNLAAYYYKYFIQEHEKLFLKEAFSKYTSPQVLDKILENRENLVLTGEKAVITVLFSDINGFTTISEKQRPEETIEMLNEFYEKMCEVVFKNDGFIKQFVGDEIMVIFGAPIHQDDHSKRALKTSIEMIKELEKLKIERQKAQKPIFDVKIGINSGVVVLGSLGSSKRMEYSAVGDVVNTASRIMHLNKEGENKILVGIKTKELAGDDFEFRYSGLFSLKGKDDKINVYELIGENGGSNNEENM